MCCSSAELILLEIKYLVFSEGFGQNNQLIEFNERVFFVILFLFLGLHQITSSFVV